jgi:hypothetical protein
MKSDVSGPVHLAHAACTYQRADFVNADPAALGEGHVEHGLYEFQDD